MRRGLGAIAVFVLLWPASASARDPERAEALFDEALALMDRGEEQAACDKFRMSMEADPAGGTALNLARCAEMEGKTATAWERALEAQKLFAEVGDRERAKFARKKAAELEAGLSTLEIEVRDVEGVAVHLDGELVVPAQHGVALPVDPGPHRVEVTAPGRAPWSRRVVVEPGGEAAEVTAQLPPAREPPTQPSPAAPEPPRVADDGDGAAEVLVTGGTFLGVGAAMITAGAILGGIVVSDVEEARQAGCDPVCNTVDDYERFVEPAESKALASNVLLGVGGGVSAIGLAMVIVASVDGEAQEAGALRWSPVAGPRGAGVELGLAF